MHIYIKIGWINVAKSIFLRIDNFGNLIKDYSIKRTHFLKPAKTHSSRLLKYHLPRIRPPRKIRGGGRGWSRRKAEGYASLESICNARHKAHAHSHCYTCVCTHIRKRGINAMQNGKEIFALKEWHVDFRLAERARLKSIKRDQLVTANNKG